VRAERLHRGKRRLGWLSGLALAGLVGLAAWARREGIPEPAIATAFGAIVAATTAFWINRARQVEDGIDQVLRRMREKEALARMLLTEITRNREAARDLYKDRSRASIIEQMRREPDFLPFLVAVDENGMVFDALAPQLVILPQEVSASVVDYYAQDGVINATIKAFEQRTFQRMPQPRRIVQVEGLLDLIEVLYPEVLSPERRTSNAGPSAARNAAERLASYCRELTNDVEAVEWLQPR
jgi:hypothetical protein